MKKEEEGITTYEELQDIINKQLENIEKVEQTSSPKHKEQRRHLNICSFFLRLKEKLTSLFL